MYTFILFRKYRICCCEHMCKKCQRPIGLLVVLLSWLWSEPTNLLSCLIFSAALKIMPGFGKDLSLTTQSTYCMSIVCDIVNIIFAYLHSIR